MRNFLFRLTLLVLLAFCLILNLSAAAETGTVRFRSVQDIAWPIPFSDDDLAADGQTYRQTLAQSSLGMALSAFRVPDVELAHRGDNIQSYLTELGFTHISLNQYDIEPSIHTIASAIGMKQIASGGETFTAVAVAVSGGGYQDEWKSNFLIGTGVHHEGFDQAARQVYDHLVGYLARNGITGHKKIWISGYSRAAATANRAAAILLDNHLVEPADLFAYTFATPNVTRQQDAGDYPSIFNIVGSFDPVPMIPFDEWGYTRYGKTYFLPTPETDSDYDDSVEPVKTLYREMTGVDYWTNQSGNRLVRNVFSMLTDMVSGMDDYAEHYQPLLIQLWTDKSNPLKMVTGFVNTLLSDQTLMSQMSGEADKAWTILTNAAGETLMQETGIFKNEWSDSAGLGENLMHEHFPKGYLAWLCAYGDLDGMISHNLTYRQISIGGDIGVQVTDASGNAVCSFDYLDGELSDNAAQSSLAITQSGDGLSVAVPADAFYRISILAHDTDPLDFGIREGKIGKTQMQGYQAATLTMTVGVTYTCDLPTAFYNDGTRYTLRWPEGTLSCTPEASGSFLNKLEINSSVKQLLSENVGTLATVLVLLLLQICIFLFISIRATLRHRHQARLRKALPKPIPRTHYRRLRLKHAAPSRIALKVTAAVLMAVSAGLLTECVLTVAAWVTEYRTIEQTTVLWLLTLVSIPYALLLAYPATLAFAAALYVLYWAAEDPYALRTGRLLAMLALPFSVVLLRYLSVGFYADTHLMATLCTWVQVTLLSAVVVLAFFPLHTRRDSHAAHPAPDVPAPDAPISQA